MTIVAFLAVCAGGAALGQLTQAYRRLGPVVAITGLAAACAAALLIGPADGVTIGEVRLSGSAYASTFLAGAIAACLLLCLVGLGSGPFRAIRSGRPARCDTRRNERAGRTGGRAERRC